MYVSLQREPYLKIIQPWLSSPPYALLLCLGVNVHDSGAGPRNISEILTQSRLSPLASNVSVMGILISTKVLKCIQENLLYLAHLARGKQGRGR